MKTLSVIIPVFNEVHFGPNIVRVMDVLERGGIEHEIILVDDGSTNGAWNEIADLVARHGNATGISLSRNFGKEAALCAGLEHCTGECAVCLDSDMQFPPEASPAMYRLWEEGYEVVEGVKRERQHEGVVYRLCAGAFYTALRKLAGIDLRNASDFRLLDRAVVDALLGMPERQTFFRGMSSWVGFRRVRYEFDVSDREEGRSKWSARGLFRLAVNAVTSYTAGPLYVTAAFGLLFLLFMAAMLVQTLYMKFSGGARDGFTTVIILQLLIGAITLLGMGTMGIYIKNIYEEVKGRPRYIARRVIGREARQHGNRTPGVE